MSNKNIDTHLITGACMGDCIHVAGITKFLRIARQYGFQTEFIGAAVPIPRLIDSIKKSSAKIIAISYRLTPKVGLSLLKNFIQYVKNNKLLDREYYLGCLPELAEHALKLKFFKKIFTGGEPLDEFYSVFQITSFDDSTSIYPCDIVSRIESKAPFPVIRAHYGLPSIELTYAGIRKISKSKVLDIISIAPDQAAQEWFHHPEIIRKKPKGSGGVPIRKKEHLIKLHENSLTGNFPLLRIYSGTQDLVENAKLFNSTIHNAWAAIPIFWYSKLDGRGPLPIKNAIQEHFDAIRYHAKHHIPVEVNDPHQWGLRSATDQMVVADAYISARIAKELGVTHYIEQLMFNTPAGNTFKMDLARVQAMIEIVSPLIDENFAVFKETRTGLAYLASDPTVAKGQLAASTMLQLSVQPNIVHVVSFSEASHAANAEDIIESCNMVNKIIQDGVNNLPDYSQDKEINARKNTLIVQARVLLDAFEHLGALMGFENPYQSPECLSKAVQVGLFDAPQIKGFQGAKGEVYTEIVEGKCVAIDPTGSEIDENRRITELNIFNEIYTDELPKKEVLLND
ncbi:MAG: methionine synthase [Promethearchaeota archaeon]|nr:MAG: methionine synthase [Candidatus Lokiarchaeota archaeon]